MMAMVEDCPVWLTGQSHVFGCGFLTLITAVWACNPERILEMELLNELGIHFMLPSDFRLNERLTLGGCNLTPSLLLPPFDKALT